MLVLHGTDDAVRPFVAGAELAAGDRRRARRARGLGALPARPRPGARQPAAARLRRAAAGAARLDRADAAGRSARSTSPRRSASATRGATSPSPASCGCCHPDLEIDWLAQHPVTAALEAAGETVHPASRALANESRHIESESAEHDLHCFQAWRRMDEILVANFMVFHDLVSERALRPLDRRRGLGDRLLPAREPGGEARRLRVADRLRRLAARCPTAASTRPRSPPTTTPR